jgi:long-chain fatty acid transport protein
MKKHWFTSWLAVLSILVLPALAFGHGFMVNEHGAKAMGMGGAFVAQANDPSAAYFNPAGIVQLEGIQFAAGVTPISPDATFKSDGTSNIPGTAAGQTTDIDSDFVFVPHLYVTAKLNDKWSVGFATFSNFGLKTDWPNDWEGRFTQGGTFAELRTFSLNPSIAVRPHPKVSLAAGVVFQYLDFDLRRKSFVPPIPAGSLGPGTPAADVQSVEANTKFTGESWGYGFNLGLMIWITDHLKFGASYRSQINQADDNGDLKFSPDVSFETGGGLGPTFNLLADTNIDASFTLPDIAYFGLAWDRGPLTLEFDVQWTNWSVWDKIEADFEDPVGLPPEPGISIEEDWKDAWAYRFGAQYKLFEYLDLRAGVIYDESPIPDRTLSARIPGGNRWLFTFGVGGHWEALTVDFAYNYLTSKNKDWDNKVGDDVGPGEFVDPDSRVRGKFKDTDAHLLGLTFIYKF